MSHRKIKLGDSLLMRLTVLWTTDIFRKLARLLVLWSINAFCTPQQFLTWTISWYMGKLSLGSFPNPWRRELLCDPLKSVTMSSIMFARMVSGRANFIRRCGMERIIAFVFLVGTGVETYARILELWGRCELSYASGAGPFIKGKKVPNNVLQEIIFLSLNKVDNMNIN